MLTFSIIASNSAFVFPHTEFCSVVELFSSHNDNAFYVQKQDGCSWGTPFYPPHYWTHIALTAIDSTRRNSEVLCTNICRVIMPDAAKWVNPVVKFT